MTFVPHVRYPGQPRRPVTASGPPLPCPDCRLRGLGGGARIGNQRSECSTCNNFAQRVMRLAARYLKDAHLEEFKQHRLQAELDLYPQVIDDFQRKDEDDDDPADQA